MSETYELQPDEKYDFIRKNKKSISFDGYNNQVHIDPTARTMTIDVDDNYEFVEEGNEYKRLKNFDTPEQRLLDSIFYPQLFDDDGKRIATPENENGYRFFPIVSHEDITKKYNGDYVYNDVFHLNAQYSEDDRTLFNPFAGLLITFPIGEGLLDYCFSFFACDPEDLLDSALEALEYNNISKDITTPKARNKDELQDLECEYMRRSIVALDPYMYRCQQIAAQKKYEEKLRDDKAVGVFRKYYKRYYARKTAGTIKPDKFRLWNYQACEKRDMCQNGEITLDEFEEWLKGSFKNRSHK